MSFDGLGPKPAVGQIVRRKPETLAGGRARIHARSEDKRGLTPLVWGHVNPYGLFRLDINTRLAIETAEVVAN
jgi:hypothetical protein